jgi:hypothetical protein
MKTPKDRAETAFRHDWKPVALACAMATLAQTGQAGVVPFAEDESNLASQLAQARAMLVKPQVQRAESGVDCSLTVAPLPQRKLDRSRSGPNGVTNQTVVIAAPISQVCR